jgi:DNA-binding response OmpR family regulator
MKLLCIEDEPGIAEILTLSLEGAGYTVQTAEDGWTGLDLAQNETWSLIILDILLPGIDGWEICRRLRSQRNRTPIIMLTALDALKERVRGLDAGADDYLPKPFEVEELLARVRAQLRRSGIHRTRIIHYRDMEVDTATRTVRRAGAEIALTPREWALFDVLLSHVGRTVTREEIVERVWENEAFIGSNIVDVYIRLLRAKLDDGSGSKMIRSVYGVGYILDSDEDTSE